MSQIFKPTNGGGGVVDSVTGTSPILVNGVSGVPQTGNVVISTSASGVMETLTPNSGGAITPIANNINDQGLAANSGANAFPLFSYNGGAGQLNWENRTYLSPYVVDPSVTNGSKGTFATLGAAITQAISDGATGDGVTIFVRDVTINETIIVSTNSVRITISAPSGINSQNQGAANPVFSGSFTNSGNGAIAWNGFNISGTITNSGSGVMYLNNSVISGTLVGSGSNSIYCLNCFGSSETVTASGSNTSFVFQGCSLNGTHTYSNAASSQYNYTIFSGTIAGGTSSSISFNNAYINLAGNTLSSGTLINFNSCWSAFNYYGNSSVTYGMSNSTAGNTYQAIRSSANYVVVANQDYYIGITSTAAPRTVTLPSTSVIKNQSFIIKDESGGAAANNITISVAGGVKTIDGSASYVISANYGAVAVIYDGINYFVL